MVKVKKKTSVADLKKIFFENKDFVFGELKNCLKVTLGKKIKSIEVEEGIMYVWIYYYLELAEIEKCLGDRVIYSLITDFDQMIKMDNNFSYNANTRNLEIKKSFANEWMKKNILDMLEYKDGDMEKAKTHMFSILNKIEGKYTKIVRLNIN
ncbi:MAG: hypothetical protein ACRCWM_13330 [Sarcina sp.]